MTSSTEGLRPPGPWTSHGHAIRGVTVAGPRPEGMSIARCMGPGGCPRCTAEADTARRRLLRDDDYSPAAMDADQADDVDETPAGPPPAVVVAPVHEHPPAAGMTLDCPACAVETSPRQLSALNIARQLFPAGDDRSAAQTRIAAALESTYLTGYQDAIEADRVRRLAR